MFIPADIRRKILRYFFENGVIVVSANNAGIHEELEVLNIYVFQLGRSFVNKGFAKKQYAWTHAYYTLNDKGIEYLRRYFGLPPQAAPLTLAPRKADFLRAERPAARGGRGPRGNFSRPGRGNFRNRRSEDKKEEAPAETPAEATPSE
ncbi:Plectin/S10 domain containing protein [Histomonas meleagridis]|uniref:Plectin/S10 domain containing protein n=1 Tax=Histomonas meleagridis TaxID=135588 RepID=UPI003559B591|nr:Plectin/S10 domain containing protein [Histomonas meleagridis]KAH0805090.1 Plectin/S10 domain containing protein [Histomonas meleagridis]